MNKNHFTNQHRTNVAVCVAVCVEVCVAVCVAMGVAVGCTSVAESLHSCMEHSLYS